MATKTRLAIPQKRTLTQIEWDRLLRRAIDRADLVKDSRVTALRAALAQGTASQTLKKMGIIGENDLLREFPVLGT